MPAEGAPALAGDRAAREMGRTTSALVVSWFWHLIKNNLHLTLAAQVFTIPLILFHFHRISLISPVSNVLIGWLIGPLTILGWATVFVGWIWFPLGKMIAWIDWTLLQYLLMVVDITSKLPFASLGN
jgi:competence protein ComEC